MDRTTILIVWLMIAVGVGYAMWYFEHHHKD